MPLQCQGVKKGGKLFAPFVRSRLANVHMLAILRNGILDAAGVIEEDAFRHDMPIVCEPSDGRVRGRDLLIAEVGSPMRIQTGLVGMLGPYMDCPESLC